ncbi:heme-binding domain-containing protein [Sabulilitoribacter arenilitoris]|uniref:Heme-binding domain-containing protein n=1 Tax=Wocania arenilitoris TaxID=2044858 RepID=A0AAE3EPB2_9FLAO|nr:heme-binding domain-containing protein [Wocania arenilitoris]MCF7568542.1 heme-binding domain-containing protein [Wocania arenilitoris]
MRIIKKILWLILIVFLIAQFFGPDKNEGDLASIDAFLEETNPPEDVKLILKETCYDCHSDVTRYPWYNKITPVNYWLANHVKHGKKHFNVSKWIGNSTKRKDHKFEELIEMVEAKEMPLNSYTWTHTEAKLSDKQIKALVDWAKQVRFKYSLEPKPE